MWSTIAKSGSELFKENNDKKKDIDIIGQFGVGFYSAFMVSDKVVVNSKSIESPKAYTWTSTGADGYSITESDKKDNGTEVILYLKESNEDVSYEEFLEEYTIKNLVKKYSDYIHYPIKMMEEKKIKKEDSDKEETYAISYVTLMFRIMIDKRIESTMNELINAEIWSTNLYLSLQVYFESEQLPILSSWLNTQAQDNMNKVYQMMSWIYHNGGCVAINEIKRDVQNGKLQ